MSLGIARLAVAFAWALGLSDRQTAAAIGISENAVRLQRREMQLRKTGRGAPVWGEEP
jgi:DNA-binding CsgD family transcriptional regulator